MTSPPFLPGDLVLLTGKGCDRSAAELMAIWTVVEIRGEQAVVRLDPDQQTVEGLPAFGTRRFPLTWLGLYRREEDEEF